MQTGARGAYFLMEQTWASTHLHGGRPLDDYLGRRIESGWAPELPDGVDPARAAFFDTETTGLAGGAGTFAFLVGVGQFEEGGFRLRQYFLHDPAGEAQLLNDVLDGLADSSMLVSFNGRQFDVPLLQARAMVRLRRARALEGIPHLDLLAHARRVWRGRVESCALSCLEHAVLGVQRSSEDVPGWAIPGLYRDYLAAGSSGPLEGVLYHNAQDILSMVTLAAEVSALYALAPEEMEDGAAAAALAAHLVRRGEVLSAERYYCAALERAGAHRIAALAGFAALLKQARRVREALPLWEEWSQADSAAFLPRVELAKHFEWIAGDPAAALRWAESAEAAAVTDRQRVAARKRLERLRRKAGT